MSPTPIDTAPADTARAMHAAEMRGQDMQDAPKYVTRFIPQFSAGKSVKRDEVLSAKQLNLITDAECQRRIDAAVTAEREIWMRACGVQVGFTIRSHIEKQADAIRARGQK